MRTCNALYFVTLTALFSGCSSPPPPVPVEWDKPAAPMNDVLPHWQDNNMIVPARNVTGSWSQYIPAFYREKIYSPAVYYAVVHSARIVVSSRTGQAFFSAKRWLREHGAKGVIEYVPRPQCLTCTTTEIYFYR